MSSVATEIHMLVSGIQRVPGRFLVIVPAFSNTQIVSEAKSENARINLRRIYTIFKILYIIQMLLVAWHYKSDQINLSGGSILYLIFRFVFGCLGCVTYKLLLTSSSDLVAMINSLYLQPSVESSTILKIFMRSTRYTIPVVTAAYICTIITSPYKPILVISEGFGQYKEVFRVVLDIVFSLYDVWEYHVIGPLSTLVLCHGMFSSYAAIFVIVRHLNLTGNYRYTQLLPLLNQLLILVSLTNSCFQSYVAVFVKTESMTVCIVSGAVLLNSTYRANLSTPIVLLMLYLTVTMYIVMAFGYYFPGLANHITAKMIMKMRIGVVESQSQKERKLARRRIAAVQTIRIRFGAVNYYERGTSLVIVNFLLEKTISLSLLRT